MSRRGAYLLGRLARAAFVVLFALTLVFIVVHLGLANPTDATASSPAAEQELYQKKVKFGLTQPLPVLYVDYLHDMATFEFGQSWTNRHVAIAEDQRVTDVNAIVYHRLKRTGWLWLWTGLIALGLMIPLGYLTRGRKKSLVAVSDDLTGSVSAFLLALVFEGLFFNLGSFLFGLDWRTFLVATKSTITRPFPLNGLGTTDGFLLAAKLAFPPALALAIPVAATATRVWRRAFREATLSDYADSARAKGVSRLLFDLKHLFPNATLPVAISAGPLISVLISGTVVVEEVFQLQGLGSLLYSSVVRADYTTLQATIFVFILLIVAASLLGDVIYVFMDGVPEGDRRHQWSWTTPRTDTQRSTDPMNTGGRLRMLNREESSLASVRATPRPALIWIGVALVLFAVEFGAVLGTLELFVPRVSGLPDLPTLLSRTVVPNRGYPLPGPGGGWAGTFMGLSPANAWAIRVAAVYVYAGAWVLWFWGGYKLYRREYRPATWTPVDVVLHRFRRHRWGVFGVVVLFVFLVAALFAPTLGPTVPGRTTAHTAFDGTDPSPNNDATIYYYDENASKVKSTTVRHANAYSSSTSLTRIPVMSYDEFDRFHPLGTTYRGTDLLTELLHGARLYLFLIIVGVGMASLLATVAGWLAIVMGSPVDHIIDTVAEAVGLLPTLPFIFLLTAMFYPAIYAISMQLLVWAFLFGVLGWSRLWRVIWPLLVSARDRQSVEADRAIGHSPGTVAARITLDAIGQIAVYALVAAAGIVITTASLTYLAHASPGSPYGLYGWGTLIWRGHGFMLSRAGHTFVVPAVALVSLILGLNATASGLRHAIYRTDGINMPGEMGRLE